jgi:hypothetical protein
MTYVGLVNGLWIRDGVVHLTHWQGEPPADGAPVHPVRRVLDDPPVFEFATPVGGSYPPWYDPSYWNEGAKPRVIIAQQLRVIRTHLTAYASVLGPFIATLMIVVYVNGTRSWAGLRSAGYLVLPALSTLALYSLVWVDWRYVGASVTILFLAAFAAAHRGGEPQTAHRLIAGTALGIAAAVTLPYLGDTISEASTIPRSMVRSGNIITFWRTAADVRALGLHDGDRVGVIGDGMYYYWARLARIRITAELPAQHAERFWASEGSSRDTVLRAFSKSGVRAVVTDRIPSWADTSGWTPVAGDAHYYVHMLPQPPQRVPR